jgi:lipid A 4'-phosphatase
MSSTTPTFRHLWLPDLFGILLLAVLATLPFWCTDLDMRLARLFYRPDAIPVWFLQYRLPCTALYDFGPWPALAVGAAALIVAVLSLINPRCRPFRRRACYLVLVLVLGPGLIANTLLKDLWGRPRPAETVEFGGNLHYLPVLAKGHGGVGRSFPSGHACAAYYPVAFYFLFRTRKALAVTSLLVAGFYGTLIGIARMAAGAHFASDILWSAVVDVTTAFILFYAILRIPHNENALPPAARPYEGPAKTAATQE